MLKVIQKPDLYPSTKATHSEEIIQAFNRRIILTVFLILVFMAVGATIIRSGDVPLWAVALGCLLSWIVWLSLRLLSRHPVLSTSLWLVYYILLFSLVFMVVRRDVVLLGLALLPWLGGIMHGAWAALLAGLGSVGWLMIMQSLYAQGSFSLEFWLIFIFGEILLGVSGWAGISSLLELVEWSLGFYLASSKELEEARRQRVELKQVQEDLLHTNQELGRLTQRLKLMTETAEETRRIKENFVANVSHELRTPLNMIIGYANLIMKSPQAYGKNLSSRLLADISAIQRNSQHLMELVNDVLDLSQVETSSMALTKHWSSIQEIIQEAVVAIQPLYISKSLYLEKKLPPEELRVYCDNTRIREVILNLLSNAGRYTDAGGVVISAWQDEQDLLISVQDTGRGIAEQDFQKVFEPFHQLESSLHHQTGGSGLGLTISKRFIEMHSGKMWLESELNKGSTFYFSIPIHLPGAAESEQYASASRWVNPYAARPARYRPIKAPPPRYGLRFVVVESEPTLQRLMQRYGGDIEIVSVNDLSAAVAEIQAAPAGALILNTASPGTTDLNGYAIPYEIPVITCWVPGFEAAAQHLGVSHYLLKPIQQEMLLSALDEAGKVDLNILYVDDDPETLHLFGRIISVQRPGYRLMRTQSGQEALELMRARQPDIVILDLLLPDLDGYAILREKALDGTICSIPVIVITSTDPVGLPVVSKHFNLYQSRGLSTRELLDCIFSIHAVFNPQLKHALPAPEEIPPG